MTSKENDLFKPPVREHRRLFLNKQQDNEQERNIHHHHRTLCRPGLLLRPKGFRRAAIAFNSRWRVVVLPLDASLTAILLS